MGPPHVSGVGMSKDDILLQVLNRIPMGSNLTGISAGAEGWFGKPAHNLSLAEAALLVGLAQAPTRNLPAAIKRQHFVLDRMAALNMITSDQCHDAKIQPLEFRRSPRPFHAPWFCDYVLSRAHAADLRTTLDPHIQRRLEALLRPKPEDHGLDFAAVVLRVSDSSLLALAVSGDYFTQQVNLATAPRSAGSTLKPFAFGMAFDLGHITRDSPLFDEPVAFQHYLPRNFDNTFSRRTTAADALVKSLNIPALHVLALVGQPAFCQLLRDLQFTTLTAPAAHYGSGIIIGNAPVSLVELANAYALFGRDGAFLPLNVTAAATPPNPLPVFTPETARLITDILSGPERTRDAVGHIADVELPRFAWKTGTSSGFRDAWTMAWDSRYVIGVWAGRRDGGGKNDPRVVGRRIAAHRAWDILRLLDVGIAPLPKAVSAPPSAAPIPLVRDALRIAKPAPDSTFVLSAAHPRELQKIALHPYRETPATLYWFLDGAFLTSQSSDLPLLYDPTPGAHTFTCTTDSGDSATLRIFVKTNE